MTGLPDKDLDLRAALAVTRPRLAARVPRFVERAIERFMNVDRLNRFLAQHRDQDPFDLAAAIVNEVGVQVRVYGLEHVPTDRSIIVVANHPTGLLECFMPIQVIGSVRRDLKVLVNDVLMALRGFAPLLVPVNKRGENTPEHRAGIEVAFAAPGCLFLCPAGVISRRWDGRRIEDGPWHRGFVTRAVQHQRDVIPLHVDARLSETFYRLSSWRQKCGVRANLEIALMLREMFAQQGRTITLTFAPPIPWKTFDDGHPPEEWAARLRERVYELAQAGHSERIHTRAIRPFTTS